MDRLGVAVLIDSGHGINTNDSKWSPVFNSVTTLGDMEFLAGERFKEHYFNWPVSKLLRDMLIKKNIPARLIRETENDMRIPDRVESQRSLYKYYKDKGFDVITISIHANGLGDGNSWIKAYGIETFCHQDDKESTILAGMVQKNLIKYRVNYQPYRDSTDRGVKHANFWHFNRGRIPGFEGKCILPEGEFMTYLPSLKLLCTNQYQHDHAKGIADGIVEYQGFKRVGNLNPKSQKRV